MKSAFVALVASLLGCTVSLAAATAETITFGTYNGPEVWDGSVGTTYIEGGISFVNNEQGFGRWLNGSSFDADPTPSTGLVAGLAQSATTISKLGGGSFDLISMDLTNALGGGAPTGMLDYLYTLAIGGGGGQFFVDGTPGYSTLLLNLVGLSSFSFTPSAELQYVQFDNVVVANVATTPVPASLPLLVTALAGLGFIAHRRKPSMPV